MQIKAFANQTSLSPKTIRYYEEIGLVPPKRLENGYRDYSDTVVVSDFGRSLSGDCCVFCSYGDHHHCIGKQQEASGQFHWVNPTPNITFLRGHAEFNFPVDIRVDGKPITATKSIIATGLPKIRRTVFAAESRGTNCGTKKPHPAISVRQ